MDMIQFSHDTKWIRHPGDNRETRLIPVFRRQFHVKRGLSQASVLITSHGTYETKFNQNAVTKDRFTPGLTSYYFRIQVQKYDVTSLLIPGENLWETTVGDGWWRWNNNYGSRLALLAELRLSYEDGTEEIVGTDEHFLVGTGPVIYSELQKGELYDARISTHDYVPAVEETLHTDSCLIPTEGVPMREKENFRGKLFTDSAGNTVIDFGQNLTGTVRMRLFNTKPGQEIRLKLGEGLDLSGAFSTSNCDGGREDFQEIRYICRGAETEEYMPHFTYAGFRYAKLTGADEGEFTAAAIYSDMEEIGTFTCSDPMINRLFENIRWSMKGNFLDAPVDCPTRERNTWTGDAQVFVRSACWLMNAGAFYEKWLKDQTIEQYESGKVGITFPSTSSIHDPEELARLSGKDPSMAMTIAGPEGNGHIGEDSVGWGDSAVWLPYQVYLMTGNRQILENQYETARKWTDYSLRCMKDENPLYQDRDWYREGNGEWIYDMKFHYGEWLEPLPPSPEVIAFYQSPDVVDGGLGYVRFLSKYGKPEVATAYTKRSCDNVAHMAEILGKKEDCEKYRAISAKIKYAYDRYLIRENGEIEPGHQAPYVRALVMDLVSDEKRPLVIAQLKKEVEKADYHLNTGFLSTAFLLPVLCDCGLTEEAYRILLQKTAPGWLHSVSLGATTIPENWTAFDTFEGSFNHYSYGSVCQFLFEYAVGIRPHFDAPGFRCFDLRPVPSKMLDHAEAAYSSPNGLIRSSWKKTIDGICYHFTVPEGTKAYMKLPGGTERELSFGDYEFIEKKLAL